MGKLYQMKWMTMLVFLIIGGFTMNAQQIYDFKVPGLKGDTIDFSQFRGKYILVVNTASKCGNTPQYEQLQSVYTHNKKDLVIVGFPANNFLHQEPGSNADIAEFCKVHYGVTFPMAAKVDVKGADTAPIYVFMKAEAKRLNLDNPVTWNFGKFLFDKSGNLIATFAPSTEPDSKEILGRIKPL
jgi:glutathione peroxidase